MHQDVARCRPPRSQTSGVVRVTQRQNAAWRILSLHSLHQSGYSCQVPTQPLELVPTSFTRFAHETSDFFARKPHVRPQPSSLHACTLIETGCAFPKVTQDQCRLLMLLTWRASDFALQRFSWRTKISTCLAYASISMASARPLVGRHHRKTRFKQTTSRTSPCPGSGPNTPSLQAHM